MNTFETINTTVSEIFEVSVDDMVSKSREQHILFARYAAMYIAADLTNYSIKIIGQQYNRKYHTTRSNLIAANNLDDTNSVWVHNMTKCWQIIRRKLYDT